MDRPCNAIVLPAVFIGVRARKIAEVNYRTEKAEERGRDVMSKRQKEYRERTEEEGEGSDIEVEADFIEDDEGQ